MTAVTVHGEACLEERLDRLDAQITEIADLVRSERDAREHRRELLTELTPVARAAMALASAELDDLSQDVTLEDAARLARAALRSIPQLETLLAQLDSANELAHEITSLGGAGLGSLSETLARAEARGYFAAARRTAATVDRMVTSLDAVPPGPAPSTLALLRRLRDPDVRRGLALALALVGALGAHPDQRSGAGRRLSPDHSPERKD